MRKNISGKRAKCAQRVAKNAKVAKYAKNVRMYLQTPDVELDVEAQTHGFHDVCRLVLLAEIDTFNVATVGDETHGVTTASLEK
jgi:hypothetical protein